VQELAGASYRQLGRLDRLPAEQSQPYRHFQLRLELGQRA
jgi:hypothetical protein